MVNCNFTNLAAVEGGALYLTSSSRTSIFNIDKCGFRKNKAQ